MLNSAIHGPYWLREARRWVGTREIPGPKHSGVIMGWIKRLTPRKLGIVVKDDEVPWCGTYMAAVFDTFGVPLPRIAVRASAWATWGVPLPQPSLGAVLVFTRRGGGHVGFYVGEDDTHYHVLGGNQSNAVNVSRLDKMRCTAVRWPPEEPLPPVLAPVRLAATDVPVTQNEA